MDEVKGIYSDALGTTLVKMLNAGLRVELSNTASKLSVSVHGFDEVKNGSEWVCIAQRLCGVKKLERRIFGEITWLTGRNARVELTLFRYLSPRCKMEPYKETLPAEPQRVIPALPERTVTKTRVVCDEKEDAIA